MGRGFAGLLCDCQRVFVIVLFVVGERQAGNEPMRIGLLPKSCSDKSPCPLPVLFFDCCFDCTRHVLGTAITSSVSVLPAANPNPNYSTHRIRITAASGFGLSG